MSEKNQEGFGVLLMLFAIGVLFILITFFSWKSYSLEDANQFLKDRIDNKNREVIELKNRYDTDEDRNIYWIGEDAYINKCGQKLKKILNINELIRFQNEGYN